MHFFDELQGFYTRYYLFKQKRLILNQKKNLKKSVKMLNFFLIVHKNFPKISRELQKFPGNCRDRRFTGISRDFPGTNPSPLFFWCFFVFLGFFEGKPRLVLSNYVGVAAAHLKECTVKSFVTTFHQRFARLIARQKSISLKKLSQVSSSRLPIRNQICTKIIPHCIV